MTTIPIRQEMENRQDKPMEHKYKFGKKARKPNIK